MRTAGAGPLRTRDLHLTDATNHPGRGAIAAGVPLVLEADRIMEAMCGIVDYSIPMVSNWTVCNVINTRAAIRIIG